VQDEVNQDYNEQNEVDGMKKGAGWLLYACSAYQCPQRLLCSSCTRCAHWDR